jgi:hypothetical protein
MHWLKGECHATALRVIGKLAKGFKDSTAACIEVPINSWTTNNHKNARPDLRRLVDGTTVVLFSLSATLRIPR